MRRQLVLLAGLLSCYVASGQQLLTSGRIAGDFDPDTGLASLPVVIDWPSTTVWAGFTGSDSVSVVVEAQPGFTAQINSSVAFVLDGQVEVQFLTTARLPYTWTKQGLSRDTHELQIVKRTETLYGTLVLSNITLAQGGR